jgi:hypothetical protein
MNIFQWCISLQIKDLLQTLADLIKCDRKSIDLYIWRPDILREETPDRKKFETPNLLNVYTNRSVVFLSQMTWTKILIPQQGLEEKNHFKSKPTKLGTRMKTLIKIWPLTSCFHWYVTTFRRLGVSNFFLSGVSSLNMSGRQI